MSWSIKSVGALASVVNEIAVKANAVTSAAEKSQALAAGAYVNNLLTVVAGGPGGYTGAVVELLGTQQADGSYELSAKVLPVILAS